MNFIKLGLILSLILSSGLISAAPPISKAHFWTISDLRDARWLLSHVPSDWTRSEAEIAAVKELEDALAEFEKAGISDGKPLNFPPLVGENPDHRSRLHDVLLVLDRAKGHLHPASSEPVPEVDAAVTAHLERARSFVDSALHPNRKKVQEVPPGPAAQGN